jgi:hypothetical protein
MLPNSSTSCGFAFITTMQSGISVFPLPSSQNSGEQASNHLQNVPHASAASSLKSRTGCQSAELQKWSISPGDVCTCPSTSIANSQHLLFVLVRITLATTNNSCSTLRSVGNLKQKIFSSTVESRGDLRSGKNERSVTDTCA